MAGESSGSTGIERWLVRAIVAALFIASLVFALAVELPKGDDETTDLPDVALGSELLYRLEVLLIVIYGGLLLLTPVFYGVVRGRLPIEISARGAKFPEEAAEALDKTEAAIQSLQAETTALRADLVELQLEGGE